MRNSRLIKRSFLLIWCSSFVCVQVGAETGVETRFRILPKPDVEVGIYYQKLKLPGGNIFKSATTAFDNKQLILRGVDARGKPAELRTWSSWELPARVSLEAGFPLVEHAPLARMLACVEPATLRVWAAPEEDQRTRLPLMAKTITPGAGFALVPEGFVVFHSAWYSGSHLCGVELTKTLDGNNFAAINAKAFVSPLANNWWNRNSGFREILRATDPDLQVVEPDLGMVLYSLSNPNKPILRNSSNVMRRVWLDQNPANQNLAIVETDAAWMMGTLRLLPPPGYTDQTWEEVIEVGTNFTLRQKSSRTIRLGLNFMDFRSRSGHVAHHDAAVILNHFLLSPSELEQILTNGLDPIFDRLTAPDEVLISDAKNPDELVKRERLQVALSEVTPTSIGFEIRERAVVQEVRAVRSGGSYSFEIGRPKRKDTDTPVFLPLDADGAMRLTNGESIFEISLQDFNITLKEFEVVER